MAIDPCSNKRLTRWGRLEAVVALDIRIWPAGYAEIRYGTQLGDSWGEDLFPDSDWLHLQSPYPDGLEEA